MYVRVCLSFCFDSKVICFYIKLGRSKVTLSNDSKVVGDGILAVLAQ